MNENLNKVLGELEENLKNLQSAREQVSSVVSNSKQLIETADSLIKNEKIALEELKSENLKTLSQILETHNQIKKLIGQLLDYDLPKNIKQINGNLELLKNEQKKQINSIGKMQFWLFFGFGLLVALIVLLRFM